MIVKKEPLPAGHIVTEAIDLLARIAATLDRLEQLIVGLDSTMALLVEDVGVMRYDLADVKFEVSPGTIANEPASGLGVQLGSIEGRVMEVSSAVYEVQMAVEMLQR